MTVEKAAAAAAAAVVAGAAAPPVAGFGLEDQMMYSFFWGILPNFLLARRM